MWFGIKWRAWILGCLSSATFSILINVLPKGFFPASRGLRQGDPLSPFLFVIIVEALSRMFSAAAMANMIEGFRSSINAPSTSHLQFADGTLLFCGSIEEQIKNVKVILLCFEAVSGLKSQVSSKVKLLGLDQWRMRWLD